MANLLIHHDTDTSTLGVAGTDTIYTVKGGTLGARADNLRFFAQLMTQRSTDWLDQTIEAYLDTAGTPGYVVVSQLLRGTGALYFNEKELFTVPGTGTLINFLAEAGGALLSCLRYGIQD
ncbi:hypothetical protein FACS1894137_19380 [Spirochaetia bacterium]|nr:hypothetical protein FACS1894137_19380 [Spirochaetia bacterium]